MTRNAQFIAVLYAGLFAAWLFSGEQFLDLMFSMPNAGSVDDVILTGVVGLEETRAGLGAPDLFAQLRAWLHGLTGLG